jgi:hypothetical protein
LLSGGGDDGTGLDRGSDEGPAGGGGLEKWGAALGERAGGTGLGRAGMTLGGGAGGMGLEARRGSGEIEIGTEWIGSMLGGWGIGGGLSSMTGSEGRGIVSSSLTSVSSSTSV